MNFGADCRRIGPCPRLNRAFRVRSLCLLSIDAFPKAVPVFLQSPQIGFQQPKYSLGIPCADAGGLNTNYEALLSVHHATCFGDMFLDVTKVIFQAHAKLTRWASKMRLCFCGR